MSHTNETPNFHLPQFTAMDKPDWLVDVNDAFQAIDTAMASTQSEAENASSVAQLAQTTAEGAAETAGQASSDVAGLTTDLETLQDTVNTVTALIGNGTPTTTDKTIIGAINELVASVEAGEVSVTADGVKTVAQLLNELATKIDFTKVRHTTMVESVSTSGFHGVYKMYSYNYTDEIFVESSRASANFVADSLYIKAASSFSKRMEIAAGGTISYTDASSSVPTAGAVYKVIY